MLPTGRNAATEDMSPKICWSGLSEDTIMNTMGKAATAANRRRTAVVAALPRPLEMSVCFTSVLLSGQVALHCGDQQHEHEEHERDGRGVGGLLLLEAGAHRLVDDGGGGIEGPALGHDADLVEEPERLDGDGHQDQGAGVGEAGPGHVAELVPAAGAVELGGLVEVPGDALQACEPDDHVEPCGLPDGQGDDGRHGGGGIVEPVRAADEAG